MPIRQGIAEMPLHYGAAPGWLFERMKRLARAITIVIIREYGTQEFLNRLSDPFWFQSFGCLLGFDWHSSGLTTTLCGALKEGIKGLEAELGIFIAGGKGRSSRKTPQEILTGAKKFSLEANHLVYASRMVAKVDNCALQDGYQLYHHNFFLTRDGKWAVVQQGMNTETRWARRYHWNSEGLSDFVVEPHKAIVCNHRGTVLNMTAKESEETRQVSVQLTQQPEKVIKELKTIKQLVLPEHHPILIEDINLKRIEKILFKIYDTPKPKDFSQLLGKSGVGPKTIRALALVSELTYGATPSFFDPVSYSFAFGGKDGHPYPVNKEEYDRSITILEKAIKEAKIGNIEKLDSLRRLTKFFKLIPD